MHHAPPRLVRNFSSERSKGRTSLDFNRAAQFQSTSAGTSPRGSLSAPSFTSRAHLRTEKRAPHASGDALIDTDLVVTHNLAAAVSRHGRDRSCGLRDGNRARVIAVSAVDKSIKCPPLVKPPVRCVLEPVFRHGPTAGYAGGANNGCLAIASGFWRSRLYAFGLPPNRLPEIVDRHPWQRPS